MKAKGTASGRPKVDPRFIEARTKENPGAAPSKPPPRADGVESTTPIKPPRPPTTLKGDKVARKKWNELSEKLIGLHTLGETDFDTLESYCLYYSEFIQARTERAGKLTLTTTLKNEIQHPLLSIERTAYDKCQRLREQLGMTPVTRSKITKTTTPGQDDLL
jgi:P27 family predicted phage terminase small subunit